MTPAALAPERTPVEGRVVPSPAEVEALPLLSSLGKAARSIARDLGRPAAIGRADAAERLGASADRTLLEALAGTGLVAAVLSGESGFRRLAPSGDAPFLLTLDPLAPSSNRGVNGPLATIFGVRRRTRAGASAQPGEFLRPGGELSAAGYVLYGCSTLIVVGDRRGVRALALDPGEDDFRPVGPPIRCPETGPAYCANLEKVASWPSPVRRFVGRLLSGAAEAPPHASRTTGSLVADLHRVLLEGGVCVHPTCLDRDGGGLRLLLEAAPLAFLVERAEGAASAGVGRVLDVRPGTLLDRVPAVLGSRFEVAMFESFGRGEVG